MSSRKIDSTIDNPIDSLLLDIVDVMNPILYKYNFTPNILTTISLIISFIAVYFVHLTYYKLGSLLLFIGYYFDCSDGDFARKYNMISKFGDYYDHIADISKMVLLYIIIYKSNLNNQTKITFLITSIIIAFLMTIHFGCQEKYYNKPSSLDLTKKLCIDKKYIKYTRFFGCGTFFIVTCTYIFNMKYINSLFS